MAKNREFGWSKRLDGDPSGVRDHARRNRMIAITAGAITVIASVLGIAGDFLGLSWHWMRPAAELLLLAELVGLVVLERHQLLEPVHEKVGRCGPMSALSRPVISHHDARRP
jgi:hypothetical protein